ncbi:MAG: 3-isopropylmalate dehydratase small subunit [Hyphomonas sp.]|nr:3-isopropylmalate dehydratase small subunit [Hyphomonas sp.]
MPQPLTFHTGLAAAIMRDNIDTDQIIPSREMKAVSRDGLSDGLFAGWRYTEPGGREPTSDFILNRPDQVNTSILISGENFGCGSSREHAVWALAEYGIRVIIAKSFGEIFHGNCLRNGILPITLPSDEVNKLSAIRGAVISVDLPKQRVGCRQLPGWSAGFEIGDYPKRLLSEGLEPIALTLKDKATIERFFAQDAERRPWLYSAA